MKFRVLLSALLVAGTTTAQLFPRTALRPLAVDPAARMRHDESRPPTSRGHPFAAKKPTDVAERYWYWNRDTWLPRPTARAAPGFEVVTTRRATTAISKVRGWLFDLARSADAAERAQAIYAIGCAGPGGHGTALITAALDDGAADVQQAALLALGEHGGTAARFRLVREMSDTRRSREFRRTAVLAYGMACAVDGGVGGRGLRRYAEAASDGEDRAAVAAADLLSGGAALTDSARRWLTDFDPASAAALPGIALGPALAGVPRDRVADELRSVLKNGKAPLRLAARAGALTYGRVSASVLEQWMKTPGPGLRALTMFAAVDHATFPEVARRGFKSATLRGVAALGLAIHARRHGYPPALKELVAASRNQRSFAERPLWVLAMALVGDPSAAARARALLQDKRTPERLRLAAADALALPENGDRSALRQALHLDPEPAVRLRAADGVARHGRLEDVRALADAAVHAGTPPERAALLVALGRSRHSTAAPVLQRWCRDFSAAEVVREGAWFGLALYLRHSGESPLAQLPRGVAFGHLSPELLGFAERYR